MVLQVLHSLLDLAVTHLEAAALTQADHDKQQQEQRPWWQVWRAAASTYASWTKAYTKRLRAVARGRATAIKQTAAGAEKKAAQEAATVEGAAKGAAAGWVVSPHDERLRRLLSALSRVPSPVGRALVSPTKVSADRVQLELLLLLWSARLVAATAEHLLTGPSAAAGVVGSWEPNLTISSTEGASKESNSSRSSSTSTECFSVSTIADQAGSGSSTSGGGKVEEGVGVSPVAPSRAAQAVIGTCSSAVEQEAPEGLSVLNAALKLAMGFHYEVRSWTSMQHGPNM